ncbi:MAG: hypothetical protein AB4062_20615 [Crocosphaera sp.]
MTKLAKIKTKLNTYFDNSKNALPLWKFRFSEESRKWKKLKNKYAGQRCFIIGNGPSLKSQNLTLLKDEVTFVTNWFILHENCQKINPTFYCLCAQEMFGTESHFKQGWNKTVVFNSKLYGLIQEKIPKAIKVFPFFFREGIKQQKLFPNHELRYLFFEPPVKMINYQQSMNLDIATQRLHTGDTVIINFCLPIAYYLGFKDIYLLGCDCDYGMQKPGDSRQYFYKSEQQTGDAPSYKWLQKSWANDGPMIKSYAVAKREFEERGRTIYNATSGGKLEVFPRVKFEDILS